MAGDIQGLDAVDAAIRNLTKVAPQAARRAMQKAGVKCASWASGEYTPFGPTLQDLNNARTNPRYITGANGKKKKYRITLKSRPSFRPPGNLRLSITYEADETHASVFIPSNALCVSKKGYNYARRIHDERYKSWRNLGPGSIHKTISGKVGEKFIERAIKDHIPDITGYVDDELRKALPK